MKNLITGLMGVGIGIVAGVYMYKYAKSAKGKKMRNTLAQQIRQSSEWTEHLIDDTRRKAMEMGANTADNVSAKAHNAAEQLKKRMNAVAIE